MFDPLSPASPTLPHFSPPFSPSISLPIPLSIHLVLFSSLPFSPLHIHIHTCIRRMGGKKAGGLSGMGMKSRRMRKQGGFAPHCC